MDNSPCKCSWSSTKLRPKLRIKGEVYFSDRLLGSGNFGKCVLYKHEHTNAEVAVKIMSRTVANLQELRVHRVMVHPNIVRYIHSMESLHNYFLVLETCRDTLCNVLMNEEDGFWSLARVRDVFKGALMGLEYIHSRGYVHRDIKLSNLLIKDRNMVQICDFGLVERNGSPISHFCGTLSYLSPEIFNKTIKRVHPCFDVWAFGCCVFAFLRGWRPPFKTIEREVTIVRIKLGLYERPIRVLAEPGGCHLLQLFERIFEEDICKRITTKELLNDPFFADDRLVQDSMIDEPAIYQMNIENIALCNQIIKQAKRTFNSVGGWRTRKRGSIAWVVCHTMYAKQRFAYALSNGRYAVLYGNCRTVMGVHESDEIQSFGLDGKPFDEHDPIELLTIKTFKKEMHTMYSKYTPSVNTMKKEFVIGYCITPSSAIILFSNRLVQINIASEVYLIDVHGARFVCNERLRVMQNPATYDCFDTVLTRMSTLGEGSQ